MLDAIFRKTIFYSILVFIFIGSEVGSDFMLWQLQHFYGYRHLVYQAFNYLAAIFRAIY